MLDGHVDEANCERIRGWVRHPSFPNVPVSLLVTADDRLLERVVANCYRPDVERAGFGLGKFGFDIKLNPPLLSTRSWLIHIRAEFDGQDMLGSPVRIPASGEFDNAAQEAFSALIGNIGTDAELSDRIAFLAVQQERLLQMRADRRSAKAGRDVTRSRRKSSARPPPRALVLDDHGVPEPERDGGSSALTSHMRSLQRLGYEVTFAAPQMTRNAAVAKLEEAGFQVCHVPWFGSVEEVLRREANSYDVTYLHRISTAAAYATLVRRYQPRTRMLYSVADLHHVRLARQAAAEDRPELLVEARRVRAQELWAAHVADGVITHSSTEADLLRHVIAAERIHTLAWSVPCRPRTVSFAERHGLAFIGNFNHAPNLDAAWQLREEIIPLVHAADAGIGYRLIGASLPHALQEPAPGLHVMGSVAGLDEVFDAVRLTVAPLRFGAGLKSKVIESLAAGIPCLCSPIAAEGLDLPTDLQGLVVADKMAAVHAIMRLHSDQAYNERLATAGLAFAAEAFSEALLDQGMRSALGDPPAVTMLAVSAPTHIPTPKASGKRRMKGDSVARSRS